jgi:hypothetical protein
MEFSHEDLSQLHIRAEADVGRERLDTDKSPGRAVSTCMQTSPGGKCLRCGTCHRWLVTYCGCHRGCIYIPSRGHSKCLDQTDDANMHHSKYSTPDELTSLHITSANIQRVAEELRV